MPQDLAEHLDDLSGQLRVVEAEQPFEAAGFTVEPHGIQHAVIHPLIPMVANHGYLINGAVFHPGDSFTVPTSPVAVLCVPVHAPWSKVSEVIDFVVSVRAPRAFQIHDALLNPNGYRLIEQNVTRIGHAHGTEYQHLNSRDTLEV